MATLAPGTRAYLWYDGDVVWHTRILLAWVGAAEYVVLTPDFDMHIEEISAANADLGALRIADVSADLPVGLSGQPVYLFTPALSVADVANLVVEGRRLAATERQARDLAAAPGAPAGANANAPVVAPLALPAAPIAGAPPAGPRLAGPAGAWVLDEPGPGGLDLGCEVALPVGHLDFGNRTFVFVGDDLRSVTRVGPGEDIDDFVEKRREVLAGCDERIFMRPATVTPVTLPVANALMVQKPGFTPVIAGPATVGATIQAALERNSGGLVAAHDRWIVESGMDSKNRAAHEHKVLSRAMQLAYSVDGLNIKNLSSFEYLNRRRQLLEDAHRADPTKPDFDGSEYYMGEQDQGSGTTVAPGLRAHVAAEFARQSAIDKERRKAREARAQPKSNVWRSNLLLLCGALVAYLGCPFRAPHEYQFCHATAHQAALA